MTNVWIFYKYLAFCVRTYFALHYRILSLSSVLNNLQLLESLNMEKHLYCMCPKLQLVDKKEFSVIIAICGSILHVIPEKNKKCGYGDDRIRHFMNKH